MVSQRFMHRSFVPWSWLLGLATVLWLAPGCGQNEGGRCQVNSDCASGLTCESGQTGNGVCRPQGFIGTTDAALSDAPVTSGPEAGTHDLAATSLDAAVEVEPDVSAADAVPAAVDATPVFDGVSPLDAEAVDAVAID